MFLAVCLRVTFAPFVLLVWITGAVILGAIPFMLGVGAIIEEYSKAKPDKQNIKEALLYGSMPFWAPFYLTYTWIKYGKPY